MPNFVNLKGSVQSFHTFRQNTSSTQFQQFPPGFFNSETPAKPFILNDFLHVPLHLSEGPGPSCAHGTCVLLLARFPQKDKDKLQILDDEAATQPVVRISSQSKTLLDDFACGEWLFSPGSSSGRRGNPRRGYRCRSDEVVKALALGYATISHESLGLTLSSLADDTRILRESQGSGVVAKYLLEVLQKGKDPGTPVLVSPAKYPGYCRRFSDVFRNASTNGIHMARMEEWVADHLSLKIARTEKTVDDSRVLKWRKPPKTSAWPWTLDHHWFLCDGSSIASAHHAMMSLASSGGRGVVDANRKDEIYRNLPVVPSADALDRLRKILELFFSSIDQMLSGEGSTYTDFTSQLSNLRWVGEGYSAQAVDMQEAASLLCLILGVRPVMDGKSLVRFAPLEGNLHRNRTRFHLLGSPSMLNSKSQYVALGMLYGCGVIDEQMFRTLAGDKIQEWDSQLASSTVGLDLCPLVSLVIPKDAWYTEAKAYMKRQYRGKEIHPPLSQSNLKASFAKIVENFNRKGKDEEL